MSAEVFTWVDADGNQYPMDGTSAGLKVLWGPSGRFATNPRVVTERVPLQPGSRVRDVQYDAGTIALPVLWTAADKATLRTNIRTWILRLAPHRGTGTLIVTDPSGGQRQITCRVIRGLDLNEAPSTRLPLGQKTTLTLYSEDPYWYDTTSTSAVFTTGTPATFFPFFPLRLSSSEVFAAGTVVNNGDVPFWPVWTITGPGSNPVLRNTSTGELTAFTLALTAGQTIVVDTHPTGATPKTVTLNDGSNLRPYLSATSSLWQVGVGTVSVQLELTAATAASSVALSYRRAWLAP